MRAATARRLQRARLASQLLCAAAFLALLLAAGRPGLAAWAARGLFLLLDPLLSVLHLAAAHALPALALLALVPLALTLVLGRFFCGWVCPFGALHRLFSRLLAGFRPARRAADPRLLRLKVLVLVAAVVAALLGTSLGTWLDPIALLTRSVAAAVDPAVEAPLAAWLHPAAPARGLPAPDLVTRATPARPPTVAPGARVAAAAAAPAPLRPGPRVATQPFLVGGLLLLLLVLNGWRRRFFCNALCPLGALYGLVARVGLLRIAPRADCATCGACGKGCTYDGEPRAGVLAAECTVCLRCVGDCPREGFTVGFARPWRPRPPAPDLGRRRLLGAAACGVALAALPRAGLAALPGLPHAFTRPPGALAERDFLARCARCGQCVQACPTGFVQPAALEAGLEGLWTPVLDARVGWCDWDCVRCTAACPTGALAPLDLERKRVWKIGTAVVDRSTCLTWADGLDCTACVDRCPTTPKAIRLEPAAATDPHGRPVTVRRLRVVPELCVGCGLCEHVCPRRGRPGIVNTAEDEDREAAG